MDLLTVKDLWVEYVTDTVANKAVNGISFSVAPGENLGFVGETGAGKTTTALSIMGLLPKEVGKVSKGEINFRGQNLLELSEAEMRKIRGSQIGMIFQDPMTSLNPLMTMGSQIAEVLKYHTDFDRTGISNRVDELLTMVGIPPSRKNEYPHQFSGGMRQRIVIAIAIACSPALLIADEPTTALDVTIQAQVLEMMDELRRKINTSMLIITHDLGIVARVCDKVAIMYSGEIVEYGTVQDIFLGSLHHPYTVGLFGSIPDLTFSEKRLHPIQGQMTDPANLPEGCKFNPRCKHSEDFCKKNTPGFFEVSEGHFIKCRLAKSETGGEG
ncbi:MAG: ABC transporter ATP-binding protein [Defluviitaleaceae bacterium]|nr:ABC transporter ATP-binding protein [Defluviitaleaceae bacterium]